MESRCTFIVAVLKLAWTTSTQFGVEKNAKLEKCGTDHNVRLAAYAVPSNDVRTNVKFRNFDDTCMELVVDGAQFFQFNERTSCSINWRIRRKNIVIQSNVWCD